jgi:energy-coupling factor transport system permease protein
MAVLDDFALGTYHPGDSFLHRLDPRLKLLGFPVLVIAAFSGGASRLVVLGAVGLLFLLVGGISWRRWWRGMRALRWLLLFTILIHLFFSPGRTLWGVGWLSRDGLDLGVLTSARLVLAVTFSSFLTLTTAPRELAAAAAAMLAPFPRLRVPVHEAILLFLLVLRFIPILREEAAAEFEAAGAAGRNPGQGSLTERARTLGQMVSPLLLRLVDRADGLAVAAARGDDVWGGRDLPRLRPGLEDLFATAVAIVGVGILFGCLS